MEILYFFEGKSKNRRVNLYAVKDENGMIFFRITTKRLVDFKTRKITRLDNIYSYETLFYIWGMINELLDNDTFRKMTQNFRDAMKKDAMKINTNNFLSP